MGATLWIVWAIIGVIGGYMAGKLLHTAHSVVLDVCGCVRRTAWRMAAGGVLGQ